VEVAGGRNSHCTNTRGNLARIWTHVHAGLKETDKGQQMVDLLPGENRGQRVMVLGADLGEECPVGAAQLPHGVVGMDVIDGVGMIGFIDSLWTLRMRRFRCVAHLDR